jgi:hypothetical protein
MKKFILFVLPLLISIIAVDVMADQTKPLFIIRRTKNINEVHYDVNIGSDGKISPKKPISAYWIMAAKDGHREKLGVFEKKAYGFKCDYDKAMHGCRLVIRSFKKRSIEVSEDGQDIKAKMVIAGKPAYLEKMFITESEGAIIPKVRSIELFGKDKITGEEVHEKIDL